MNHNIREIYTKAIVAKGKKLSRYSYTLCLNHVPDEILGCTIMNHCYKASMQKEKPQILGTFDIHLWYRLGYESHVEKHTIQYVDDMQVSKKEQRELYEHDHVQSRCLTQPKYLSLDYKEQEVYVEVEKEMLLEITGETCIRVEVKDEMETWDDLENIEINPHFIQ